MKSHSQPLNTILPGIIVISTLIGLYFTSFYNYLLFHSIAEVFSIIIAFGIFMFAWNSRRFLDNHYMLFIGIAYVFIGSLDFLHTLAYSGMGVFDGYDTNLPTQLWIAARYMESVSLLVAPFFTTRHIRAALVFSAYLAITTLLLLTIFYGGIFPACFVEGVGLTTFKKSSEYLISAIFLGALLFLSVKRNQFNRNILWLLVFSICLTILAELAFTFYISAYGLSNLIGHFLKIISFFLIYKAVIETGVKQPYSILLRDLKAGDEKLSKINEELEKRVEQRTVDLKKEIVEREKVQEDLYHSKTMLQTVFEGISDVLFLVDSDFTVKMFNHAATSYFNMHARNMTGIPYYQILNNEKEAPDGCEIRTAIQEGRHITFEHESLLHPGKTEKITVYPIQKNQSEKKGAILRISDITESKLLEIQLIHNEKLASIGFLVAGIAHEINNPINFITFNIPILKEYLEEIMPITNDYAKEHPDMEIFGMTYDEFREDVFKLVENMEHGSKRINTIISNLKEFSRRREDKEFVLTDIRKVIEKGVGISHGKIRKMVKTFEVNIPENLPEVFTDPQGLEQVLVNLMINAAQSSDKENSWVRMNVTTDNTEKNCVIIEIKDNGCGMNDITLKKIFDPFFSTKKLEEGTGLGLYICHNLIHGMGAQIKVESKIHEGSTFQIILPEQSG